MKNRYLKGWFLCAICAMLFVSVQLPAQVPDPYSAEATTSALNLSTFTGIVAVISLLITQLAKVIPVIYENKLLKVLTSLVIGVSLMFLAWWLNFAPFLQSMSWGQVLLQGFLAGGTACGAYDLITSIKSKK